jgi:site-specific DNA-methyltransferase (adenine-specific)
MIDLRQGDCLDIMKSLPDGCIDAIITDPPYGTTACKWDSVIPFEPMWAELKRIIKPNGAIVLFGQEPFSSYLRLSNIKLYRYDWIWKKNTCGGFATAKKMPLKKHENILVFYKSLPTYNPQFEEYSESTKKRFKDGEKVNRKKQVEFSTNQIQGGLSFEGEQAIMIHRGTYPQSIQEFKNEANSKRLHPTQKPMQLIEYLVKTYTNENETVLDFTMGSGTTGVACKNLNRNFIGIELDESYFNIAKERIGD